MVLPGCSSLSDRDLLDSSHESGLAAAYARSSRGRHTRARKRAHVSQKQRSPGCVLTLRRPGFDTQLSCFRTFPNPRSRQAPSPTWRLSLTRKLAKFPLRRCVIPVPAYRFLERSARLPDPTERTSHGHLRILAIAGRDCNRDCTSNLLRNPYTYGPKFGADSRYSAQNRANLRNVVRITQVPGVVRIISGRETRSDMESG